MMTCSSVFSHIWHVRSCKYWYVHRYVWFLVITRIVFAVVVLMMPSFRQQSERDISFSPPTFELRAQEMCSIIKKNSADYPIPHHLTHKFVPPTIRPAKFSRIPRTTRPNLLCYSQAFYWNRPVFRFPNILLFSDFLSVKLRYSLKPRIIAVKLSKFNVNCRKRKIGKD